MRIPVDAIFARMLTGVHEAGYTDIVPAHLTVLRYPGPDNRRPSELAADTRMSKQAMNYLLGQLEQLGYLTRVDDPSDQRFKRVQLTSRGHALVLVIRETVRTIETELADELGADRLEQLRALLVELNGTKLVGSVAGDPRGA